MFQRKLLSMYADQSDEAKEKSALYKFIEGENRKWKEHYQAHVKSGKPAKVSKFLMRSLMIFQAPTQIYAFTFYIIPYVFADYGPWTMYYMKVLAWFVLLNGLANWFCVILYDPHFAKTKDNPFLQIEKQYNTPPDQFIAPIEQAASNQNGHCVYDMTSKEGLPWNYCDKCVMYVPPRAHHCNFCKKCILKRDHHCFMVGNCIGFKNQRYFIVLAFYAMITGIVGGYFTFKYVHEVVWPELNSWADLIFPITIWHFLFGTIKGIHCLLVVHLYLEFLFGVIGFVYFTSQMSISANGKTLFEVAKKVPIRNMNSMNRNLKSVFGDFWALNFLFPMTLVFRQRDDGIHWDGVKIDHNANQKWKDDEEIL